MSLRTINQVADLLGVTADDIIDAGGLTLGELEHAACEYGLTDLDYRKVPILTDRDLRTIADRLGVEA